MTRSGPRDRMVYRARAAASRMALSSIQSDAVCLSMPSQVLAVWARDAESVNGWAVAVAMGILLSSVGRHAITVPSTGCRGEGAARSDPWLSRGYHRVCL